MGGEDGSVHNIGKFDGTDFAFWRMQMEDYLYGKKLHQPLSKKPEKMDQDEWELLDRQVLGVIRLTLSKNVAHNVAKEKTTEGLMKVLSDMYEKISANNKVFLMKKLFHLKMEEGGLVAAHVNEFNTIVNQLSSVEIDWEPMRAAVSNYVGTQKLKFNDVRDRILSEEVRRIDSRKHQRALLSTWKTEGETHIEITGVMADRSQGMDEVNPNSDSLQSAGIMERQVTLRRIAEVHRRRKTTQEAEPMQKIEARDAATSTTKESISYVDSSVDSWVLDSGASFHTTPHHNIMENYVAGNYGNMSDGRVWKITKVRHVPKLMRNLISVGQLDDTGHDVNFGGGAWRVKKGSMVVARGHKRGTLYMTTSYQDTVAVVENAKQTKLWHCRLGHMSEKGMKLMVENGASGFEDGGSSDV
uniref:GAG-pre-integrase domain-containing protein n=2 Tax=Brassica TaxID=3705 RepID=A0A0D3DKA6_BRAOL